MSDSGLKTRAFNGVLWNGIDAIVSKGINFIFNILIARLLLPSDFGTVAMLGIFLAVAQSFIDSGFGNALIRKQDRSEADFNTVFYFNILVAVICFLIIWICAPFIAKFYNIPELAAITRAISTTIVINALCNNQWTKLSIDIDFKKKAIISISAVLTSGLAGIILAANGFGAWTLVYQSIIISVIKCALLWLFIRWTPKWQFSWESFKELGNYGYKLLLSGLIGTLYNNIHTLVIGKVFDANSLGYYSRARAFGEFPSTFLTTTIQTVSFPVLSSLQNDFEKLRAYYIKFIRLVGFVVFPLMICLAVTADPIVRVLLTDKWEGCIHLLRILCFALIWYPINAINLNILIVLGRSDIFLKLEIIKRTIGIITLIATIPLGIEAICYGQIIVSLIEWFLSAHYSKEMINYGISKQIRDLSHILISAAIMGGVAYFSMSLANTSLQKMIIGITTCGITYFTISALLKFEEFKDMTNLVVDKFSKIRK